MGKILFVSERIDKVQQYSKMFDKRPFEFFTSAEESSVMDIVNVNTPDVIIFDVLLPSVKSVIKKVKSMASSTAFILLTKNDEIDSDLLKYVNAFITEDMSESLIVSTVNVNLKTKTSLEQLSNTNKNLADSLYRLNVLYSTSSQFAGSLDKQKLY